MQIFDTLWGERLLRLCLSLYQVDRYMDDGRFFMPPIRHGWRWSEGKILFSGKWKEEDAQLSSLEVTRRVMLGTMEGVVSYLKFTMETQEDFSSGWLLVGSPTNDTLVGFDKGSGVGNENQEGWSSSQDA